MRNEFPVLFLPRQKVRSPTGSKNHAVPLLNYYHHKLKDWVTAFHDSGSLSLSTTTAYLHVPPQSALQLPTCLTQVPKHGSEATIL